MNHKVTALWTLNKMTSVSEKRLPLHKHSIICSSRCSCHTNRPTSTPVILSVTSTAVDLAEADAMRSWGRHHMDWPGYFQAEKHGSGPLLHWCAWVCLASRPELRHVRKQIPKQTQIPMERSEKKSWNLCFLAAAPSSGCARAGLPVHLAPVDLFPGTLADLLCWA